MLYLGSIGTWTVFYQANQKNHRKITIKWSFSYNSFVKFNGKTFWERQHDCYIQIHVIIMCVIIGLH